MPVGGKPSFRQRIQFITNDANFVSLQAVGIVRDADDSAQAAFDSLCSSLENAGLASPPAPLQFSPTAPRIGIMIMPPTSMGSNRMLEDVCLAAMQDDPAMPCLGDYFDCLQDNGIVHREREVAKARLHAFLASRERPDLRLGEAAAAGYWDFSSPPFAPVITFLRQLTGSDQ